MNEQELEWENEFQNFIKPIRVMLGAIKNLLLVLNAFYTVSQRENIKKYDNLERDIKNGFLCDFPQITENESIENINNIIPNFDKKKKLKDSFFFVRLFHSLKEDSTNIKTSEEKIFIETEKEFEKLLILFKENEWVSKIDVNIINECYNVIKEISMDEIKIELNFIKKYFYLNDVKDEHIQKIQNEFRGHVHHVPAFHQRHRVGRQGHRARKADGAGVRPDSFLLRSFECIRHAARAARL